VSIPETFAIYVCTPLAVVVLLTIAVFGKTLFQTPNRYRPGRPWTYPPVWYLPHTAEAVKPSSDRHQALTRATRAALDRGNDPTGPGSQRKTAAMGGAVGEW